jgi:hypothetical protein
LILLYYPFSQNASICAKKISAFFEKSGYPLRKERLSLFVTVAAGTLFRVAIANVAYVDFTERAVIARSVVLAFGNTTTNAGVDFLRVHHSNFLLFGYKQYAQTCKRLLTFFKFCCTI